MSIGDTTYGKPILDRTLRHDATLEKALRAGLLSFNSTRASSSSVGPPVDAVLYERDSFAMKERRFTAEELEPLGRFWQRSIEEAVERAADPVAPLAAALGIERG